MALAVRLASSIRILYFSPAASMPTLRTTAVPTLILGAEDARIEVAKSCPGLASAARALLLGEIRDARGQAKQPGLIRSAASPAARETRPSKKITGARAITYPAAAIGVSAGQDGGRCEIRTRDVWPRTRFSNKVDRHPPGAATVRDLRGFVLGGCR
jgi:hypothetical protein